MIALSIVVAMHRVPSRALNILAARGRGVVADCASRSIGTFKHVIGDRANLTVGPLILVGGAAAADVAASELRRFAGSWKLPVLVRPGYEVTVQIAKRARHRADMSYRFEQDGSAAGPDEVTTFVACGRRERRHDSRVDGRRFTFWSGGFTAKRIPACIPLEIYVDDEVKPRRVPLSFAVGRCPQS